MVEALGNDNADIDGRHSHDEYIVKKYHFLADQIDCAVAQLAASLAIMESVMVHISSREAFG